MSNPGQLSIIALLVHIFLHMGQRNGASVTSKSNVERDLAGGDLITLARTQV